MKLPDGVPCKHPGCLNHISHPCEGCGRLGGRYPDGYDPEVWDSQPSGRPHYEPLEETTWPTYGGITRGGFDAKATEGITLHKLTEQLESMPKFPKAPPYYRCHPATYQQLLKLLPTCEPTDWSPEWAVFRGLRIEQDPEVTLGEFWPPEKWKP